MAFFRLSLLLVVLLATCGFALRQPQHAPTRPQPRQASKPKPAKPKTVRPARPTLYDHYVSLARKHGLTVTGPTVLGLRGVAPDGQTHPATDNASDYDDTFVILLPATKKVTRLRGATHAGQLSSTLAPAGVAQLKPGIYRATPCGEYADMPCWLLTTRTGNENLPSWRDADHDGTISQREQRNPTTANEILFHNGRYDDYPSSIGCQTMPPKTMQQFIRTLGAQQRFDYLLCTRTSLK